jgi:hypothetical protein
LPSSGSSSSKGGREAVLFLKRRIQGLPGERPGLPGERGSAWGKRDYLGKEGRGTWALHIKIHGHALSKMFFKYQN